MINDEAADSHILTDYRFLEPIAIGSFGEVWKVDALLGTTSRRLVAMKISHASADSQEVQAELRGLRMAASLEAPALINLLEITEAMGRLVVVMELADNTAWQLAGLNRDRPVIETARELSRVAHTIDTLVIAGIVHGGITPTEIVYSHGQPRLIDFSLLHGIAGPFPRPCRVNLLTWACMSPEMRQHRSTLQSDQYSLAASYAMLRLMRLSASNPWQQVNELSGLGPSERQVVIQALSENPAKRFQTCAEFASNLEAAVELDCS